jgi:hypothetical protein
MMLIRKKIEAEPKDIYRGKLHKRDVIYFSVEVDTKGGIHAK